MRFTLLLLVVLVLMILNADARKGKRKGNKGPKRKRRPSKFLPNLKVKRKKCKNWATMKGKDFCNGKVDCPGGIDELEANSTAPNTTLIRCNNANTSTNKTCLVMPNQICLELVSCLSYTPCDHGCSTHFLCSDGVTCKKRSTVCDRDTCNDCPSHDGWDNGHGFKCARSGHICKLPQVLLWDGIQDCDDGSDLCYETPSEKFKGSLSRDIRNGSGVKFNAKNCFRCLDGSMIINRQSICDDVFDCPDMSDECLCEGKVPSICKRVVTGLGQKSNGRRSRCSQGQVVCGRGGCIDRREVCDGKVDCPDGIDEDVSFCGGTKPCANATTVNEHCRCSDLGANTCYRKTATYCNDIEECISHSRHVTYNQPATDECSGLCHVISNRSLHNQSDVDCSTRNMVTKTKFVCQGLTRKGIVKKTINATQRCDGVWDCKQHKFDFRNDEVRCPNRFKCKAPEGKISISKLKKCDGYKDCLDGKDESKTVCRGRYFCKALKGTKVSIGQNEMCDSVINCDDQSDEMGCDKDGRFYCENGKPLFVRKRQKFNGIGDCTDWSDECPTLNRSSYENALFSRYELIANPFLRALVWVMGISALIGNTVVMVVTLRTLRNMRTANDSPSLKINHMLILNLATADIIMALYLLILGAMGVRYSGNYCLHDLSWRSGNTCKAMGIMVVLSSETSVFTMVVLTSLRLYAIYNPFASLTKPKARYGVLLILLCWVISFLLAFIPTLSQFESTFSSKALILNNRFFQKAIVSFTSFQKFLSNFALYLPTRNSTTSLNAHNLLDNLRQVTTWHHFNEILQQSHFKFPNMGVQHFFGYYSEDSVCIPKIFVTTRDTAWKYSIAVTVINFVAFLYVAIAYVVIYLKSSARDKFRRQNGNTVNSAPKSQSQIQKMQKKILRLIITDFCCWVPISIMSFLNFGGIRMPTVAYAVSAIVLLPINSALNPIIYSNVWMVVYKHLQKRKEKLLSMHSNSAEPSSSNKVAGSNL